LVEGFSLIFVSGWAIFFGLNPKIRKPMTVIGLLIVPTTTFQFFYMKDYWNPPSVLPIVQTYGFDIESLLWTFFSPGISLAVYALIPGRSAYRPKWKIISCLYSLGLIGFFLFNFVFGANSINAAIAGMVLGIVGGLFHLNVNFKAGFVSALTFFGIYVTCFFLLNAIDATFVRTFWRIENVSGIFLLNIPLEEILFGLFGGIFFVFFSDALTG
jgi:hypothetical protein